MPPTFYVINKAQGPTIDKVKEKNGSEDSDDEVDSSHGSFEEHEDHQKQKGTKTSND